MASSEPKNIPLAGLFPFPEGLADAPVQARATFWRLIGQEALRLKRLEILSGIDRWGDKFQPVKRKWGNRTPLIPHGEESRTYRLLAVNSSARGATLFWRSGGGRVPWPKIMGYHAYKHGARSLPVRDEIGMSPRGVEGLVAQSEMWQAGYEAGLAAAGKRVSVVAPPPGKPRSRSRPKREAEVKEDLKLTRAEDRRRMSEADRLAREAAAEAKAIMDEARLVAIRERVAEEKKRKAEEVKRAKAKTKAKVKVRKETAEEETARLAREAVERARASILAEISAAEQTLDRLPVRGLSRESLQQFAEARRSIYPMAGMVSAMRQQHGPDSPEYKAAWERMVNFEGTVKSVAKDLISGASRENATKGSFHGMAGEKTFHSVEFEGIKYHYEEGLHEAVAGTLTKLSAANKLPETLTSKTKDIYFVEEANRQDDYWKQVYNDPDHVSAATGGYGQIVIYNGRSLGAESIAHEMGHNLAGSIYGSTHPSSASAYRAAMDSGEPAVSAYARNSPAEDFAESVKYYFTNRKDFEELHPKRFKIIDRLMKGEDLEG